MAEAIYRLSDQNGLTVEKFADGSGSLSFIDDSGERVMKTVQRIFSSPEEWLNNPVSQDGETIAHQVRKHRIAAAD